MRCSCAVASCKNTSYNSSLTFFRFPKARSRFLEWGAILDRTDIMANYGGTYFICELHFDESMVYYGTHSKDRKNLTKDAMPCLHLFLQEDHDGEASNKRVVSHNTNGASTSQDKMDPSVYETDAQMRNKIKNWKAQRSHIRLFLTNPQAYLALKETLDLPEKKELANLYAPELTKDRERMFYVLKERVACMTQLEKSCSILIRQVPIKPHLFYNIRHDKIYGFHEIDGRQTLQVAKFAVVVMARGIYKDWHIPVDLALLADKNHSDMAAWCGNLLTRMTDTGLYIKACISNIEPHHLNFTESSFKNCFISHSANVNQRLNIFFMYNPDYLFFQARKIFMKYKLQFQDVSTNWEHVSMFYEIDSKKMFKIAPQLTDDHMGIGCRRDTKIMTKHVFSNEIAAGISAYMDFGQIPESARGTVLFISLMIKLKDYLQSSSEEKNYAAELFQIFETLKVYENGNDITDSVKIIEKFLITLKSIVQLRDEIKECSRGRLSQFPLKFLKMDVLNKLIVKLQKSSTKKRFTCYHLIRAYRTKFYSVIMNSNTNEKGVQRLSKVIGGISQKAVAAEVPNYARDRDGTVKKSGFDYNYKDIVWPERYQFLHVCGYILKKIYERHNRKDMLKYLSFDATDADSFGIYLEYRQVCSEPMPIVPRDSLVVFLQRIESELQNFFRTEMLFDGQGEQLLLRMKMATNHIELENPCVSFPVNDLREFYIRLRIYHLIKLNNKDFKKSQTNDVSFKIKYLI